MHISRSKFNNGYISLVDVGTTYITANETINTESSSTGKFILMFRVEYPKDLPLIGARMIRHLLDTQTRTDVRNESIGDYSVGYMDIGSNSYPVSIAKGLNKYRKVSFI
jgi:hypothetical protein